MRPGDFSPGNLDSTPVLQYPGETGFNEAGGFLPRKPTLRDPGEQRPQQTGFNEAGGFLPRKLDANAEASPTRSMLQ